MDTVGLSQGIIAPRTCIRCNSEIPKALLAVTKTRTAAEFSLHWASMKSPKIRHIPERRVPGKPLGRHVHHDPRSRAYAYAPRADVKAGVYMSVKHTRHIPVLNQNDLGSCTGNACEGAIGTSGLYEALPAALRPSITDDAACEAAAVQLYSRATQLDGIPGSYPPSDTGSDGLSVAKAAKEKGLISGYLHAFSLDAALRALEQQPIIVGIDWYEGFDNPGPSGLIQIAGTVRGGHEIVLDEIDATKKILWFTNSWGPSWGVNGRANMSFTTLSKLLKRDGDATILLPLSQPSPQPIPLPRQPWSPLSWWSWMRGILR